MDCIFVKRDFMIVNSNDITNVKGNYCIDLQCTFTQPTGKIYIQWCSVSCTMKIRLHTNNLSHSGRFL